MDSAHELWSAAQLAPGEGIEDGVARIEALLALPAPAGEPEAPEPFDYCYEWDGPFGTRKFSVASHNGLPCARSVPIFRADQLRAYGDARAEHARRVAMEAHQPSITWVDNMGCTHTMSAKKAAAELKALFDAWPDGMNEVEAAIEGWRRRAAPPQGEQT